MKLSRHAGACAAALVLLVTAGPAASASTTIGEAPQPGGVALNCGPGVALQASVGSGADYVVPQGGGVITSWTSSLSGSVELATFRGAGTSWTRTASAPGVVAGTPTSFPARIPVQPGDRIGLVLPPGGVPGCAYQTSDVGDQMIVAANAPPGTPTTFVIAGQFRVNVAAVIEPDADGDGYGDETQDFCLGDPARHAPCEPKPSFTKKPPKRTTKAKASFSFTANKSGATFTCAVDGGPFRTCTSPFRKRFRPGRHSFQVQALDRTGNRSVPIGYTWTVLKTRKHR